jgi:hypothetical protein
MSEKDVSNEEAACADTVVQAFALSPLQRMVVLKESANDGIRASLLILDTTTCTVVAPPHAEQREYVLGPTKDTVS